MNLPGMTKIATDTSTGAVPFPQRNMKELAGNSLNEASRSPFWFRIADEEGDSHLVINQC
jgi:hypothetical protein